jgi:predicted dehydrogenase
VSTAHLQRRAYPVDEASAAYADLQSDERPLLVLLEYPDRGDERARTVRLRATTPRAGRIRVALVGAGSFAQAQHVPNLLRARNLFEIRSVMSRTGSTARSLADRIEAAYATTDLEDVLGDEEIDLVLISTRHDTHADLALRALEAGKNVFVEKPLAIAADDLDRIEAFYAERAAPVLLTGFNRRFAPAAAALAGGLTGRETPLVASYRMNAGYLPPDHWVHGPEGGGRNIGEACHIYDLFNFLTGAEPRRTTAVSIGTQTPQLRRDDNFIATVRYADGSVCSLTYTALGHRDHPKERLDVFCDGNVYVLDDWRSLSVTGRRGGWRSATAKKGHLEELQALGNAIRHGGPWPIPLEEQLRASRISLAVEECLRA